MESYRLTRDWIFWQEYEEWLKVLGFSDPVARIVLNIAVMERSK